MSVAGAFGPENPRRVLAAQKTVHDAVTERVETARSSVIFREHRRHPDKRQRSFPLPAVQMAVAAGDAARREAGGFGWRVREDSEPCADLVGELRVVE